MVLQMEDHPITMEYARRSILRHPDDVVWIQVDRSGDHVVRWGERLLLQADPGLPVKLEIVGHGGHDLGTRSQTLSDYVPTQLVDRVVPVMRQFKLASRADHVTLLSCALETPSVKDSFGSQFLKHAIAQGLVHDSAEVVAYGEIVAMYQTEGQEWIPRMTRRYHGADDLLHAPGVTWTFKKNAVSGEIDRIDKYAGIRIDVPPAAVDALPRHGGQAGTLREAFHTMERALRRSGIEALKGSPPAAAIQTIRDQLLNVLPTTHAVDAKRADVAAKAVAEGLWEMNPMKLHEGFAEMHRMYGVDSTAPFHPGDLPSGLIANVRFPTRMLATFQKSMSLPAAEVGLSHALKFGVIAMSRMPDVSNDGLRKLALGQQTVQFVQSILAGRPFVVDADRLARVPDSEAKRKVDATLFDMLSIVHGSAVQMARRGAISEPIYMTDTSTGLSDGWESHPDGSRIHRGDLLPTLLPDRKKQIEISRVMPTQHVQDAEPLKRLAGVAPGAKQALDRNKGTITITWPGEGAARQGDSILRFTPLNGDASKVKRSRQDADIAALDRFIVPAFFPRPEPAKNSMPGDLVLADGKLTAGRAVLAKQVDGRWINDVEMMRQAQHLFGRHRVVAPPASVADWQHGDHIRFPAAATDGRKLDRLRIALQLEDDVQVARDASNAVRRDLDEAIWIQADRLGKQVIRHGADLLKQFDPSLPIELTVHGSGSLDDATRSARLAGYSPSDLVDRVASVLQDLKLNAKAGQVELSGSQLVTPFLENDYAEAFLDLAIRLVSKPSQGLST